jgi:putative Holliday junction resolvase
LNVSGVPELMLAGHSWSNRSGSIMSNKRNEDPIGGTVLAFDFGTKRIGVAVGETDLRMAHAIAAIDNERNDARFAAIVALIDEWRPRLLVVGLPFAVDGSEHEMTARCRRFANQLAGRFGLPVHLVDERFSSSSAEAMVRQSGAGGWASTRSKGHIDAASAQVILQAFFDQGDSGMRGA